MHSGRREAGNAIRSILAELAITLLLLGLTTGMFCLLRTYSRSSLVRTSAEKNAAVYEEAEQLPAMVRVRILADQYSAAVHESVTVCADRTLYIRKYRADDARADPEPQEAVTEEQLMAGSSRTFTAEDFSGSFGYVLEAEGGTAICLPQLVRNTEQPEYAGRLCLWEESGAIAVINELSLEEYLYSVVSSEMPADFPLEAQKAQAVCARSYAVQAIRTACATGETQDLDDSVNDQVYGNSQITEAAKQAVDATAGEIISGNEIQYYSTSALDGQELDLSEEQSFSWYLSQEADPDAEYGSPWFRWEMEVPKKRICDALQLNAEAACSLRITHRQKDGRVDQITISQSAEEASGEKVRTEQDIDEQDTVCIVDGASQIRQLLGSAEDPVTRRDGQVVSGYAILPSAWFTVAEDTEESLYLKGGGFGHGNGMSQYGAAALAKKGMDYLAIIRYYYGETIIGKETS